MTNEPIHIPSGKVPGRTEYKGLYRANPPALTSEESGDVLPPISIGLSDLLGGIDGIDHGRRRVYNLSDEQLDQVDADTDDAGRDVLTAEADDTAETDHADEADDTEGLEL